jgi:xanthine/CO dehydrogenase XdhC/CoxF family maturation factor
MIHWKETAEILARLFEPEAAGRRAALATVVRIAGSSYRRPGAKLLIEEGGETLGSVSGGCLEADVREVGLGVLAGGGPRLLHYDTGADEDTVWGLGLGCNGTVEVFVQAATEGPLAEQAPRLRELLAGEDAVAVVTALDGDGAGSALLVTAGEGAVSGTLGSAELNRAAASRARALLSGGRSSLDPVGDRALFFDVLTPPRHLLLCGAGDDARPLAAYAADAGFRVTVADHRPALLAAGRFPRALATVRARPEDDADLPPLRPGRAPRTLGVVMTHSLAHDRGWARRLLAAGVPYVGLLGPRGRTETLLAELGAEGDPRVYGPVGLDLGADGPRQVALAIVAELLAVSSGREPRHLSERREAIHAG